MHSESLVKPPTSARLKCGKVTLQPGESIGAHVTDKREEILLIAEGEATLLKGEETVVLREQETSYIPEGVRHDVVNHSQKTVVYFYVVAMLDR